MNCQGVAAGLAVLIADDSSEVFKVLERLTFLSIQSLIIPFAWLIDYHNLSMTNARLWQSGLSVMRGIREGGNISHHAVFMLSCAHLFMR